MSATAHYTTRNRQLRTWKLEWYRTTKRLIGSGMLPNGVTTNHRLPSKQPADLGFEPMTFLGDRRLVHFNVAGLSYFKFTDFHNNFVAQPRSHLHRHRVRILVAINS